MMSLLKRLFTLSGLLIFVATLSFASVDPRQIRTVSDHVLYTTLYTTGLVAPEGGEGSLAISSEQEIDLSDKVDSRYNITGLTLVTDEEIKITFLGPGINASDGSDEVGEFYLGAGDVGVYPIPNLSGFKLEATGDAATVYYYVWCARLRN